MSDLAGVLIPSDGGPLRRLTGEEFREWTREIGPEEMAAPEGHSAGYFASGKEWLHVSVLVHAWSNYLPMERNDRASLILRTSVKGDALVVAEIADAPRELKIEEVQHFLTKL